MIDRVADIRVTGRGMKKGAAPPGRDEPPQRPARRGVWWIMAALERDYLKSNAPQPYAGAVLRAGENAPDS
jgi:hypothetical protein